MTTPFVCRICKKTKCNPVINLGDQPLVNSLLGWPGEPCEVFPLLVVRCEACGHVQIRGHISGDRIYKEQDYLYYSGDMPGLGDYFREYTEELAALIKPDDFVVEIGSNDGTMLGQFMNEKKLGVDPSTNVVVRALKNGVPTVSDGFTDRLAWSIRREFGVAGLIYGNNCIAHIDDLHVVLRGVNDLLSKDGIFVVECNYWGGMVKNLNYSLIYHDHFSYFTVKDWQNLAEMYGLCVFDAVVTPAQGGSLRIFLSKKQRRANSRMFPLIREEINTNLNSGLACRKFREGCLRDAKCFGDKIREAKGEGKTIAGYGAAAKGFTLLSLAGITDEIDFFVDDSPAKQGRFTPIHNIPVVSRLKNPDPDVFVITAPNYAKIIMEKEKAFLGEFFF